MPSEEELIRREFERRRGSSVHQKPWRWTVEEELRYFCEGNRDDVAWTDLEDAYNRNLLKFQDSSRPERAEAARLGLVDSLGEVEPEDEREKTLHFALAALILRDPEVRRFERWSESGLVPSDLLANMRVEMISRLAGQYGLPIDDLERVVSAAGNSGHFLFELRSRYHSSIRMQFHRTVGTYATTGRLTLEVSPWVSERRLASEYRRARHLILGRGKGSRQLPVRTLMVIQFVEVCRLYDPNQSFRSMVKEWNELVDGGATLLGAKFDNKDSMSRTYTNGINALLKPSYLDDELGTALGQKTVTIRTLRQQLEEGRQTVKRRMSVPRKGSSPRALPEQ